MCPTCTYLGLMSKMIQLRHVPDDLHRRLKARAAQEGLSLSDFLIQEARKIAERPTPAEIQARLARRAPVVTHEGAAQAVRAEREAREPR
jgi:plasmid stability protein